MAFNIHEGTFQMINSSPTNFLILMFFKGYEMGTFHAVFVRNGLNQKAETLPYFSPTFPS